MLRSRMRATSDNTHSKPEVQAGLSLEGGASDNFMHNHARRGSVEAGRQQEDGAAPRTAGMPWDDSSLVAGLKMRDSSAVQYAVETYAPKLYRYAVYQLGEHSSAEDLVSEVITRMLEKIDGYRITGAPFQAWLFSIARNLVTDSYRRSRRATIISLDASLEQESDELHALGSVDPGMEAVADQDAFVRILAILPEEQRQILTLRVVEGWQPMDIARLLGKSLDSVKSSQYRALQTIKRHMEKGSNAE